MINLERLSLIFNNRMSKRGYISRYLYILQRLKTKPYSSLEELQTYLQNRIGELQTDDDGLEVGLSDRTLQRDFKEISRVFGVDIVYSRSEKGYFIHNTTSENASFQRMMEAYDIFNSLNLAQNLSPYIQLEQRKPQGTENLHGLLHAIKNKKQIRFSYQKFWDDAITQRTAEPYLLKEFKSRWYVMAKDTPNGLLKSFGLDRLANLEITNRPFEFAVAESMDEKYRYCFGIISPEEGEPEDILLSFDGFQGKYIKTLPLHETQEVVYEDENEIQVRLKLYVTHDFVMELLSMGNAVEVMKPESLIETIKRAHEEAVALY